MCGVNTKIVTWYRGFRLDRPRYQLLRSASGENRRALRLGKVLRIRRISSHKNTDAVEASALCPSYRSSPTSWRLPKMRPWSRMYHYFMFNRDEFLIALPHAL